MTLAVAHALVFHLQHLLLGLDVGRLDFSIRDNIFSLMIGLQFLCGLPGPNRHHFAAHASSKARTGDKECLLRIK